MTILPFRTIRNEPGKFEETLSREGVVILNKSGQPLALVIDAATESLDTLLRMASQVRAQLAVAQMRASARERGLDSISTEEILAEIEAVRLERTG